YTLSRRAPSTTRTTLQVELLTDSYSVFSAVTTTARFSISDFPALVKRFFEKGKNPVESVHGKKV
ncbi:hypothetical protein, partial [Acidaminococcus fermentans]|uniref:hypothetical protein n=1 Tax=Acidaminococcus fermentans TaxID=905 RepID=UPI00307AEE62